MWFKCPIFTHVSAPYITFRCFFNHFQVISTQYKKLLKVGEFDKKALEKCQNNLNQGQNTPDVVQMTCVGRNHLKMMENASKRSVKTRDGLKRTKSWRIFEERAGKMSKQPKTRLKHPRCGSNDLYWVEIT